MAFSATKTSRSNAGGLIVLTYDVDFDSVTSGTVKTGLFEVHSAIFQNEVTEGQGVLTRSGGDVALSGVTSSDTGTLTVIGR